MGAGAEIVRCEVQVTLCSCLRWKNQNTSHRSPVLKHLGRAHAVQCSCPACSPLCKQPPHSRLLQDAYFTVPFTVDLAVQAIVVHAGQVKPAHLTQRRCPDCGAVSEPNGSWQSSGESNAQRAMLKCSQCIKRYTAHMPVRGNLLRSTPCPECMRPGGLNLYSTPLPAARCRLCNSRVDLVQGGDWFKRWVACSRPVATPALSKRRRRS